MSHKKEVEEPSYLDYKGKYSGILSWILSTDHKRIGLLYLFSIMAFFVVGATLGLLMKFELIAPGKNNYDCPDIQCIFYSPWYCNDFRSCDTRIACSLWQFSSAYHDRGKRCCISKAESVLMVFICSGVSLVLVSQFAGEAPPDTGWTFYAPYSFRTAGNMLPAVFGAFVLGFSSILTGLNFLVTMHRMRAPGMTWLKMPLFPWTLYATGWVQLLATPIVGITFLWL